jgi:CheY-specific phosphatase CheX
MIVGNFKNSIHAQTGPLGMSTPTVICGRQMTTTNGGAHEWIVFPFRSVGHSFQLIVQLQAAGQVSTRAHEAMQHALATH